MDEEDFWEEPEALYAEDDTVDLSGGEDDLYEGYGESGHYADDEEY